WTAIVEGGTSVLATALRVALANKWLATPNTMAWGFDAQWEIALTAAEALTMCALLVGGVMLLTRTRVAIPILRLSVACSIVLMFVGTVMALHSSTTYASYWSKPATAAVEALQVVKGEWPELLIGLLTLPPLARRMV